MLLSLVADPGQADQIDWLNLADATNVVRVIGLLIPILTALVTKKVASQGLKSVVTTALSAITAGAAVLVAANGHSFDWQAFLNAFINTFLPAIAIYYGLYKPTGLAGSVANATQRFGIGSPPVLETADKGAESPQSAAGYPHAGEGGYASVALVLVVLGAVGVLAGLILPNHLFLVLGAILLVVGIVVGFASGRRTTL